MNLILIRKIIKQIQKKNHSENKRKATNESSNAKSKKTKDSNLRDTSDQPTMRNEGESLDNQQENPTENDTLLSDPGHDRSNPVYSSPVLNQNIHRIPKTKH